RRLREVGQGGHPGAGRLADLERAGGIGCYQDRRGLEAEARQRPAGAVDHRDGVAALQEGGRGAGNSDTGAGRSAAAAGRLRSAQLASVRNAEGRAMRPVPMAPAVACILVAAAADLSDALLALPLVLATAPSFVLTRRSGRTA